jgi:hypothetical protein
MRCRCHSSCRRSRFSQLGTQICGKSSLSISFRISCASCRSVFCFRTRLARISASALDALLPDNPRSPTPPLVYFSSAPLV